MNGYSVNILRGGHVYMTEIVEAESESAVRQTFIDEGIGENGDELGAITLEYSILPDRYSEPVTLFDHLVAWHLDTDEHDTYGEAIADAEDQARRLLALVGLFVNVDAAAVA